MISTKRSALICALTISFIACGDNPSQGGGAAGEGTLDDDGNIILDRSLGVMPYACEGTFDESEMLLTCNGDCPVRLVPQG